MKIFFKLSLLFLITLNSCKKDELTVASENTNQSVNYDEISIIDGRMSFPNISTFQSYYYSMREKETNEIAEILEEKYYSKDFFSLKPIVSAENEEVQMKRHFNRIKSSSSELQKGSISEDELIEDFDDLEDVFGEDLFASFINQDAEIQVGDKIYKYTDTGLFISDDNKINDLNNFLEEESISKDLLVPTDDAVRLQFMEENNPSGGLTSVDEFQYYYNPNNGSDPSSESSSTGFDFFYDNWHQFQEPETQDYELAQIANGLEICDGATPFFGNLWGVVKVCKDKYEDRRRVKIKYYDIDVLLVYVTGIKTKHQYKGWTGFWSKENTDELAMGINSVSWKFNIETPPSNILGYQPARIYLYNGKMYETITGYYNAFYAGEVPMPALPFGNDLDIVVEIAIGLPLSPLDNEQDVTEFFYQNLYNTVKNVFKANTNKKLEKMGVVFATNQFKWVQYYDLSRICGNCEKIEHVFDFGIMTPQITYTFGTGNGGNYEFSSWEFDFKNPDLVGLNAYGMGKRNGQWHGKRFVF